LVPLTVLGIVGVVRILLPKPAKALLVLNYLVALEAG